MNIGTATVISLLGVLYYNDFLKRKRSSSKTDKLDKDRTAFVEDLLIDEAIRDIEDSGFDPGDLYLQDGFDVVGYEDYGDLTEDEKYRALMANKANVFLSRRRLPQYILDRGVGITPVNHRRRAYLVLTDPSQVIGDMIGPEGLDYPGTYEYAANQQNKNILKNPTFRRGHKYAYGHSTYVTNYYNLPFRPQPSN